jgi:hypothetical protein
VEGMLMVWLEKIRRLKRRVANERFYEKITDATFPKIIEVFESQRPYLDPDFTLPDLCRMVGANRTYVSKSLHRKNTDFNTLVRGYRRDCLVDILLKEPNKYDKEELAIKSGFPSMRTMLHLMKKYHPDVYRLLKYSSKKFY